MAFIYIPCQKITLFFAISYQIMIRVFALKIQKIIRFMVTPLSIIDEEHISVAEHEQT